MRILVTIPHYYKAADSTAVRVHGSLGRDPRPRVLALASCIAALHQLYGASQCYFDLDRKTTFPANDPLHHQVDVVVCTTRGRHLLAHMPLLDGSYQHHPTDAEPLYLGFECHAVLRDRLGVYDYYGYMEDDLIARTVDVPQARLVQQPARRRALLQPNRFEVAPKGLALKGYIDGPLAEAFIRQFQDLSQAPELFSDILTTRVVFQHPRNPHSGCFFLNARQMEAWSRRPTSSTATPGSSAPWKAPQRWGSCVPSASTSPRRARRLPRNRALRPRVPRLAAPSRGCTGRGGGLGRMTIPALSLLSG